MAQLCVQHSEIFLNFAPQPTLHLVISSCPPTKPPASFPADLHHIVSLLQKRSSPAGWRNQPAWIWAECCVICWLGIWRPSGALRSLLGRSHFLPPPASLLHFSPLLQLPLFINYFIIYALSPLKQTHIYIWLMYFYHVPFFHSSLSFPFCSTKLPCPDIFARLPQSFLPFFLFLRTLFVNVQRRRMREQIMKHRSAFHTLFRKNSPTVQRGRGATSPPWFYPHFQSIWLFLYLPPFGGGGYNVCSCFSNTQLLLSWSFTPSFFQNSSHSIKTCEWCEKSFNFWLFSFGEIGTCLL